MRIDPNVNSSQVAQDAVWMLAAMIVAQNLARESSAIDSNGAGLAMNTSDSFAENSSTWMQDAVHQSSQVHHPLASSRRQALI